MRRPEKQTPHPPVPAVTANAVTTRPLAVTTRPLAVTARPLAVTARPPAATARPPAATTRPLAATARPKNPGSGRQPTTPLPGSSTLFPPRPADPTERKTAVEKPVDKPWKNRRKSMRKNKACTPHAAPPDYPPENRLFHACTPRFFHRNPHLPAPFSEPGKSFPPHVHKSPQKHGKRH